MAENAAPQWESGAIVPPVQSARPELSDALKVGVGLPARPRGGFVVYISQ